METQENPNEQGQTQGGESPGVAQESPEEFAQEVENDPSTADAGDDDELEQVRGG